jgi:GH15 family glucan-1,4-alpha-glucosidase
MFDSQRATYADVRFAGGKGPGGRSFDDVGPEALYLWDTSANFGFLWGYPDHHQLRSSNAFYAANCVNGNGGMQYFDAPDPGLSAYGHDLFFFTTAAAAQYQARCGDPARARMHIDWMLANANVYGLMPERIFLSGSGCSQASPLSWCCAEFAAALLEYARADGSAGH